MADNPIEIAGVPQWVETKTVQDSTTISANNFGTCYQTLADRTEYLKRRIVPSYQVFTVPSATAGGYTDVAGYFLFADGETRISDSLQYVLNASSGLTWTDFPQFYYNRTKRTNKVAYNADRSVACIINNEQATDAFFGFIRATGATATVGDYGTAGEDGYSITHNGTLFVASTSVSGVATIADDGTGATTLWSDTDIIDLASDGAGQIVGATATGSVKYGTTADASPTTVTVSGFSFESICWDARNSVFVAAATSPAVTPLRSADGITWTAAEKAFKTWSGDPPTPSTSGNPGFIVSTPNNGVFMVNNSLSYQVVSRTFDAGDTWEIVYEADLTLTDQADLIAFGDTVAMRTIEATDVVKLHVIGV